MSKLTVISAAFISVLGTSQVAQPQTPLSHPNNFSMITAVPRGCLESVPSLTSIPEQQLIASGSRQQTVFVPGSFLTQDIDISVKIWRHGCHNSNRSAIMLNLSLPEGLDDEILTGVQMRPSVKLRSAGVEDQLFAALMDGGFADIYGGFIGLFGYAVGDSLNNGVTYVLDTVQYGAIPSSQFDALIERYNAGGELVIEWTGNTVTADIPPYAPSLDLPQQPKPTFNGRMTGQWVADNLPATGLLLQVGEVPKQFRNFIFAIWFTYIDGQPVWMAANKDIPVGTNEITLDMGYFEGGKLFTSPTGFNADNISNTTIGKMTLRIINCNKIEATTDFSSSDLGSNSLVLDRLIRIAGYDCDGTQAIR